MHFVTSQRLFIGTEAEKSVFTPSLHMNGITFYESDTQKYFLAVNGTWIEITNFNTALATGLYYGGQLSINGSDPETFDITEGAGVIVDNITDPLQPIVTTLVIPAVTAEPLINISDYDLTYVYIDEFGTILQQSDFAVSLATQAVFLGALYHESHTEINVAVAMPILALNSRFEMISLAPRAVVDYLPAIGLTLFKTEATVFRPGINYFDDEYNPNVVVREEVAAEPLIYMYRDGSGGWIFEDQTSLIPEFFDNGSGTLQALTISFLANQLICYHIPTGRTYVYYGQQDYTDENLGTALQNLTLEEVHPVLHKEFLPMYWFTSNGDITDFTTYPSTILTRITTEGLPLNYMSNGDNYIFGTLSFGSPTLPTVTGSSSITAASPGLKIEAHIVGTDLLVTDFDDVSFEINDNFIVKEEVSGNVLMTISGPGDSVRMQSVELGFYSATPITKPTVSGSRASGAALVSLLTALVDLGLITDSTSA